MNIEFEMFVSKIKVAFRTPTVFHSTNPESHSWAKQQKTAKISNKKFGKFIDHSYFCNHFTSFQFEADAITGNGKAKNML